MSKKLSINGVVVEFPKELNASDPYTFTETPSGYQYYQRAYGLYYNAPRYPPSDIPALPNSTGTFTVPAGHKVVLNSVFGATVATVLEGQGFTIERFHNFGHHEGIFRLPNGYRYTRMGWGDLYKPIYAYCSLTANYSDGSTFDYGEVPCDAKILLIPDCCEYPKSKQKINNILAMLGA